MCKLFRDSQNSDNKRFIFQSRNPGEGPMIGSDSPGNEKLLKEKIKEHRATRKSIAELEEEIQSLQETIDTLGYELGNNPDLSPKVKAAKEKALAIAEKNKKAKEKYLTGLEQRKDEIAKKLAELRDDEPPAVKQIRERENRGTLHVPSLPELLPDENDSINPGQMASGVNLDEDPPEKIFPALKPVTDRLDKDKDKAFKGKTDTSSSPALAIELMNIRTAFLYKAIAENWSPKTLYNEYERAMGVLYDKAAKNRPAAYWVGGKLYRAFNSLWSGPERKHLDGPNRFLKGPLKPADVADLETKLEGCRKTKRLETFRAFSTLDDGEWVLDPEKVDTDGVQDAEEDIIPFITELYINSAIVEEWKEQDLIDKYNKKVGEIYGRYVKNMTPEEQAARAKELEDKKQEEEQERAKDKTRETKKESRQKAGTWDFSDDVRNWWEDLQD